MFYFLHFQQQSKESKSILYNGSTELQIRGSTEDNSKINFLNSQRKHIL